MRPRPLEGKTALVTGAGTGIGQATATALAHAGADLVLCDVNAPNLAATAAAARDLGRTVTARTVDVGSRTEMEAFAAEVHRERAAVDVLVNNAGVALGALFVETPLEDWQWIVGVNLWGVVHGCHLFVPPMVARGQGGHVVNVSSAAGFFASRYLSAYSATKFAVFGLSEALREELRPHGIGVSVICPGLINTPITASARLRGIAGGPGTRERLVATYQRRNYGADRVAARIVDAIVRNRAVVPVTPEAWAMYLINRFSPRLATRIGRALNARLDRELGIATRNPGASPVG